MTITVRYLKTQTRRVQVQCALMTVMICGVVYLTVTAKPPSGSPHLLLEDSVSPLQGSHVPAEWTHRVQLRHTFHYATAAFPGRGKFSAGVLQPSSSSHVGSADDPASGPLSMEMLTRQADSTVGDENHAGAFHHVFLNNVDGAAVRKEGFHKGQYDFVFPELNVSSLESVDLSRVGQLNLLYFDSTRRTYPSSDVVNNNTKQKETEHPLVWTTRHNATVTVPDLHMTFQPIISRDERLLMLFVFQTFIHACERHGLTYFLYGGALLGAYRHHDVIPWDDDIDVMMAAWQRPHVTSLLSSIPGFGLWNPSGRQWKFYWQGSHTLKHKDYRWPYIDIFFFKSNGTHVYDDNREYRADYRFPLRHVFPLQLRPFAGALLPVPCNMAAVLRVNYFPWLCETSSFLHKLESPAPRHLKGRAACRRLFPLYPFVFRQHLADFSLLETLIKGGNVLSRTIMPPFCGEEGKLNGSR